MTSLVIALVLAAARVQPPAVSPASGSYENSVTVTVTTKASGATTYCALDAVPKRNATQRYTAPFALTQSHTVSCRSWANDARKPSLVTNRAYTITTPTPQPGLWADICTGNDPNHPEYVEPTTNVVYFCSCDDPLPGETTTYPRDPNCVAGNDANNGLTKAAPKRSFSAALSYFNNTLQAGGTIAFCKGGRWNGVQSGYADFYNTRCTASQPCTLRDYTPTWGGTTRPILAVTGTGDVWGIALTNVGHAGIHGLRVLNFTLWQPGGGVHGGSVGVRGFADTYDILFCNNIIDGFALDVYVGGGAYWGDPVCNNGRWNWYGNRFLNSCGDALLYSADYSTFDGNYFDNNGHAKCYPYIWKTIPYSQSECTGGDVTWVAGSPGHCEGYARDGYDLRFQGGGTTHTTYLDSRSCNAHFETFKNNEFYRTCPFRGGYNTHFDANGNRTSGPWYTTECPEEGCPQGPAISVGVYTYDTVFENNYIEWTPAHPSLGVVTFMGGDGYGKVSIKRNIVKQGYGRIAQFDSMSSVLIENNIAWVTNPNDTSGLIYVPQGRGSASAVTVRNNTLYITGANSNTQSAIHVAATGGAYPTNVSGNSITFTGGTGRACLRVDNTGYIAMIDNNQCSGSSYWGTISGNTNESLASWRSSHGWDLSSTTTAATFEGAPTNLTPALGSVLLDAASQRTDCTVLAEANQSCSSTKAIDPANAATWSTLAQPKDRTGIPDIGAVER